MKRDTHTAKKVFAVVTASALALSMCPANAALAAQQAQNINTQDSVSALPTVFAGGLVSAIENNNSWWGDYFNPVNDAVNMLTNTEWVAESGSAADIETFKTWFEDKIRSLNLEQVTVQIDYATLQYVAPVDGTLHNQTGIAGSFSIEVQIYRSWLDAFAARHVTISGTIDPIVYSLPPVLIPDQDDPGFGVIPDSDETEGKDKPKPHPTPDQPKGDEESDPDKGPEQPNQPSDPSDNVYSEPPATVEEAVNRWEAQAGMNDEAWAEAWTISSDEQDELFVEGEDEVAAIENWVVKKAQALCLVPVGHKPVVGETTISDPVESGEHEGERSFRTELTFERDTAAAIALQIAAGMNTHPLNAIALIETVAANANVDTLDDPSISAADQMDPIIVEGTLAAPRTNSETPGADDPTGSDADANQNDTTEDEQKSLGNHPLAKGGTETTPEVINSEELLQDPAAPREVKRVTQLDGETSNSIPAASTTTIQHGTAIAPTYDETLPFTIVVIVLIGLSAAMIVVGFWHLRHDSQYRTPHE